MSGDVGLAGADSGPAVVWETEVRFEGAPWLRLFFKEARLADGAFVRITSLHDGYKQELDAFAMDVWGYSTAYFNGEALRVQIIATRPGVSRLAIDEASVGEVGAYDSICGTTDDRIPSNDPRQGRAMPVGCTAWLIDDCARCFLTAGHCSGSSLQVIQFNVPFSLPSGAVQHPPPEDQYTVDVSSKQSVSGGMGNDWGYFGVIRNTTTGMTPYEKQGGGTYRVAVAAPSVAGQSINITGYGTTSSPISPTWNQIQKTHDGPFVSSVGTTLRYAADTTGGNSGSPVVDNTTGMAIGIHTHAGCSSTPGSSNVGTNIGIIGLRNALLAPRGVCTLGLTGDTNGDRIVNFADLNVVLSQFGMTGQGLAGDVNRDGVINFTDLNIVLANWLASC